MLHVKTIASLKILSTILLILVQKVGVAQYTETQLLEKIASFQVEEHDFYDVGLFPSKRTWSFSSDQVEDNTIFFTASIISSLQMIKQKLDTANQEKANFIMTKALPVYEKYKSRNGEVTFNFWQTTSPDLPFPNGNRLLSNERVRLPDDFNTCVLIALSQQENKVLAESLRTKMEAYSARENRGAVKLYTRDKYRNMLAYETWFGKNMPQAFDLSVISNVLLFVFNNEFELNEFDKASIDLVKLMIKNEDHFLRTSEISFYSNSPAQQLYHVARLIAADNSGCFGDIREKVIQDLMEMNAENEMEQVIILSSLHRLGIQTDKKVDIEKLNSDISTFSFFSVNPFNISKGESLFLPTVTWVSEAYNWALYLEYVVLSKGN